LRTGFLSETFKYAWIYGVTVADPTFLLSPAF
jgi:hypothetical protein